MDTPQARDTQARRFALRGIGWSLGLFGLMRLNWFETHAVLPVTQLQARVAQSGFGAPALPIDVTLACSGADAFALCAGAILAYRATWRMRIGGAAAGIALILILNTMRIGTLGRAAASPSWFQALHLYVWPTLLTVAIAGYVFTWMLFANRAGTAVVGRLPADVAARHTTRPSERVLSGTEWRFVALTALFLVLFTAASPLYLESSSVLAIAAFIARTAGAVLRALGIDAVATDNVLSTARGSLLVTQECISTPLIPVYFAAVLSYSRTWQMRVPALLAAAPLFVVLGIARLLIVAIPGVLIGSPIFFIHAFYQLLLAAVVVCIAASWSRGTGGIAWRRALVGAIAGGLFVYLLGSAYTHALMSAFAAGTPLDDSQGAMALLPAFQLGLYVALSIATTIILRWRSFITGLAVLCLMQIAVFALLHYVVQHAGITPHVRDVRAWALAGPLFIVVALVTYERTPR